MDRQQDDKLSRIEKENKMMGKAYADILKYCAQIDDEDVDVKYVPDGKHVVRAIKDILLRQEFKLNLEDAQNE